MLNSGFAPAIVMVVEKKIHMGKCLDIHGLTGFAYTYGRLQSQLYDCGQYCACLFTIKSLDERNIAADAAFVTMAA